MYVNQAINFIVKMYFLQIKLKERFTVELVGPPGVGKDDGIAAAATTIERMLGEPFMLRDFFLTTVEPTDVRGFGIPSKDANGTPIMVYTMAPWMPRSGDPKHGMVFLNEYGQANDDVKKPSAELLLKGRVGDSHLPITYMVIAASNREEDRSGVGRGLAFIENRRCRISIVPNLDSWVDWAERHSINPFFIAFAKFKPGLVFSGEVPLKPGPFCTPRTLVATSHLYGELDGDEFAEAAAGYIGEGTAAELHAYLRVKEEIPTWPEIVADPGRAKLPPKDRIDATYAVMQMVSHHLDAKSAVAGFTYLQRLPKEFQIAGLRAVIRRVPQVLQVPDFSNWLRNHKELVMAASLLDKRTP